MSRVGCAILAAGASRRLGRPKQLLLWRGNELVRHLANEAVRSRVENVAVIVGAQAERVACAVEDLPVSCLLNFGWREGVASSIRCAAEWAMDLYLDALIVAASDQPFLDANHLNRLVDAQAAGAAQVGSRYGGVVGIPAIFAASAFPSLLTVSGDVGASALLRGRPETRWIDWPSGEIDIDTSVDLACLLRASLPSNGGDLPSKNGELPSNGMAHTSGAVLPPNGAVLVSSGAARP